MPGALGQGTHEQARFRGRSGCNVLRPQQRPCRVQATLASGGPAGNGPSPTDPGSPSLVPHVAPDPALTQALSP